MLTEATIHRIYKTNNYILDPHGAVAFLAAEEFNQPAIILETAHPVKFPEVVERAIGETITIPENVQFLFDKEKVAFSMIASYQAFKTWMLANAQS
jgi:threonine synthase